MLWNADGVVSRCERLHVVSNKDCLDILAKLEEAVNMWGLAFGGASPQADMDRPCDAGCTYLDARHQQQRQRQQLQQCDLFAAVDSKADAAWQCMWWCRRSGSFVCCSSSAGTLWGEPAINRLGSAPRSGMGSGEQSAAVEGKEDARRASTPSKDPLYPPAR
jgi:hypothetical protein